MTDFDINYFREEPDEYPSGAAGSDHEVDGMMGWLVG